MSTSNPLRVAIVGCGQIAKGGYQPRCLAYPNKIKLVGYRQFAALKPFG